MPFVTIILSIFLRFHAISLEYTESCRLCVIIVIFIIEKLTLFVEGTDRRRYQAEELVVDRKEEIACTGEHGGRGLWLGFEKG